jgi:myosin heavy subunit
MDANKDAVPNNLVSLIGSSDNSLLKRLFAETPYFGGQGSQDSEALLSEDRSFVVNLLLLNLDEGEFSSVVISDTIVSERPMSPERGRSPTIQGFDDTQGRSRAYSVKKSAGGFVVSEKILTKFKNQLGSLMDMVNATDVQYVRCIKPNPNKSSTEYDRRMVVEQLRSAGMIEAVRISRAAYPNRLSYPEFMQRFHLLKSKKWHNSVLANLSGQSPEEQVKGTTKAFLAWIIPNNKKELNDGTGTTEHYAFGHTKVYFTSFVLETLEAARNKALIDYCVIIQKNVRMFVERSKFKIIIAAIRAEQERLRKVIFFY